MWLTFISPQELVKMTVLLFTIPSLLSLIFFGTVNCSEIGRVTTLAGTGSTGYANGFGTNAAFNNVFGVALTSTQCLVADHTNKRLRYVRLSDQFTGVIAGSGSGATTNGVGTNAGFLSLSGIAITPSESFMLVTDPQDKRVRMLTGPISLPTVSTLAGSGSNGENDGTGLSAQFKTPMGIGK